MKIYPEIKIAIVIGITFGLVLTVVHYFITIPLVRDIDESGGVGQSIGKFLKDVDEGRK